jgi:ElaB/YqjD/DUF883 family membrane-anchored ribosome-binding protein
MADIESRLDRIESSVERLGSSLEKLVDIVGGLAGFLQELAQTQKANAQAAEERFRHIETIQMETTEKLNALVQIVDEWIRNKPSA